MNKQNRKVKFYEGNGAPMRSMKINRNDPCKCGSGKKAKNCCGCDTRLFYSKPEHSEEWKRKNLAEKMDQLVFEPEKAQ